MNDLTMLQMLAGMVVVFWGLCALGALGWIVGKLRKGPEIF